MPLYRKGQWTFIFNKRFSFFRCNFLDKEAYHTHLCLKHFYKDLLDKFTNDNGAGTGRIAGTEETGGIGKTGDTGGAGGAILKCPKMGCICKFKNAERAVIHLGIFNFNIVNVTYF